MSVEGYVVEILEAVLNQTTLREKPEDMTFDQIYDFSHFHCIEAMVFYGISRLKCKPENPLYEKWEKERDRNILKCLTQQAERDRIIKALTSNGICTLPLKGCQMQEMYPQPDYRQMADIDILIDGEKTGEARKLLEDMGYVCDSFQKGHHDNYSKLPFMEIEIHRKLLPETNENHRYYENVWDKVVKDEDNPFLFHFSWSQDLAGFMKNSLIIQIDTDKMVLINIAYTETYRQQVIHVFGSYHKRYTVTYTIFGFDRNNFRVFDFLLFQVFYGIFSSLFRFLRYKINQVMYMQYIAAGKYAINVCF